MMSLEHVYFLRMGPGSDFLRGTKAQQMLEQPPAHLRHWADHVQASGPWSLQYPWAQAFPLAEWQAMGAQLPLQKEFISTTPTWGHLLTHIPHPHPHPNGKPSTFKQ